MVSHNKLEDILIIINKFLILFYGDLKNLLKIQAKKCFLLEEAKNKRSSGNETLQPVAI